VKTNSFNDDLAYFVILIFDLIIIIFKHVIFV